MAHKPILIIGFERSGTTLLRRVVSMCPALDYDLLHERKRLIEYGDRPLCLLRRISSAGLIGGLME